MKILNQNPKFSAWYIPIGLLWAPIAVFIFSSIFRFVWFYMVPPEEYGIYPAMLRLGPRFFDFMCTYSVPYILIIFSFILVLFFYLSYKLLDIKLAYLLGLIITAAGFVVLFILLDSRGFFMVLNYLDSVTTGAWALFITQTILLGSILFFPPYFLTTFVGRDGKRALKVLLILLVVSALIIFVLFGYKLCSHQFGFWGYGF